MKYLRTGRFNKNLDGIQFEEVLAEADDLGIKEMVDDLKKPSVELLHKYVINLNEVLLMNWQLCFLLDTTQMERR